jgi:hypothetical protein
MRIPKVFSPSTYVIWNAHLRRLERYTAEVSNRASSGKGLGTDDPRDILGNMSGSVDYGAPVRSPAWTHTVIVFLIHSFQGDASKRSQRRMQWKVRMAERKKIRN